jgi:hypothetical protein
MKRTYEDPRLTLIRFAACDILTTSGLGSGDGVEDPWDDE